MDRAPSTTGILWSGLRCRCPRCGQGALFEGYLEVTDRCSSCGLGFASHDAGDGPAVLVIFILGFLVVGLAFAVERAFAPPLWVHAALWTPLILGGAIGLLRPLKGVTVALQYRFRSVERPGGPGGQ
jgi:uncharacterized protein (DUF983 family)